VKLRRHQSVGAAESPAPKVKTIPLTLDEDEHALAKVLLSESREELTRADGKASLLLAALGVGISAILAAILAGSWSPFRLAEPYQSLWWAGSFFAGVSFACLFLAIYPRVTHRSASRGVTYFGDVAGLETVDELRSALKRSETDPAERSVMQLHVIAGIADRKYRFVRSSLNALSLAIVFTVAAVLLARIA
jgi:Family of unknown function (DUF5706)